MSPVTACLGGGGDGGDGCLDPSDGYLCLTVLCVSKPAAVMYTHITVTVKIKVSKTYLSTMSAASIPLTAWLSCL